MSARIIRWRNVGIAIIVIAVIVICAVPLVTVPYVVAVSYEDTETYYVSEAYQVKEPYTVQEHYTRTETYYDEEPYQKSVPIDYRVTYWQFYNWIWSPGCDVWVRIKNTDLKSGTFTVTFYITLKGGATITKRTSKYIAIGDYEDVMVKYDGARCSSFTYSVTPPKKTITDYRTVQKTREITGYTEVVKYRDVTKYRDVPKQRTVTKTQQETRYKKVTVLEYLINYA